MSRVVAVMACGFTLAACSSLSSWNFLKSAPQTEVLRIESAPPGAEAKTSIGQNCRTPCELAVQAGSEFSVTLALSGYQPQTVSVRPEAPSTNQRDADGFAGVAKLAPNPVSVELQAAPAAPAVKKPITKKKKTVAGTTTPASAPSASPTPAAEPVTSATNYPWPSR
jgi:hypothetical protein